MGRGGDLLAPPQMCVISINTNLYINYLLYNFILFIYPICNLFIWYKIYCHILKHFSFFFFLFLLELSYFPSLFSFICSSLLLNRLIKESKMPPTCFCPQSTMLPHRRRDGTPLSWPCFVPLSSLDMKSLFWV